MATEKVIEVRAETKDAVKQVEDLKKEVEGVGESAEKSGDEVVKSNDNITKSAKKSNKAVRGIGKGFKALGTAMKAAGIGLVVAVVAKLTQAFSRNQVALDAVNKVMETVNIVFNEISTAITNAFEKVSDATGGFESMTKVVKGLMTIALTPLKLLFDGIKLTVQGAQLAWEQSFFGDGNPETIKQLNANISETQKSIANTAGEAVKAGKDVASNIGDAINEVGKFYKEASKGINDISVENAKASADRIVQLRNEAELAEAQLGGLTLKFQQQAEVLRQERDDIRLSIEDRIKANEELGKVLQRQSEEELKLANKRLALAQEELRLNPKNIENQKALQEALNGVAEVEERITGQKSEQRVNEAALLNERRANLEELRKIGLTEQELAKQESENELENQKQLIERTVANEKEKKRLLEAAEQEHQARLNEIEAEAIAKKQEAEQKKRDAAQKTKQAEQQAAQEKLAREEALKQQTIAMSSQTLGAVSQLLGEQSKAGKAFAIAQALINTYQGITAAVASAPFPFNIPAITAAAATGFGAVKNIVSTNVESPSASGGGAARPSSGGASSQQSQQQVQAPAFNIVGDSGTNQIADVLGQNQNKPVKAFVVSKEVSSQQELDRNIQGSASLG